MEYPDEFWKWVTDNIGADIPRLRLAKKREPWTDDAITQIQCRRRAAKKLPRFLAFSRFLFPTELSAEQSTSEQLAEFHSTLVGAGQSVVDLTAGLGVDALTIAARAASVTAIEIDPKVAAALSHNATVAGTDNLTAINDDCVHYLETCDFHADTAFIDPARRGDRGQRLFALSQCYPDVTAMLPLLRRRADKLIVKASPMLDVSATAAELPGCVRVIALGTRSECKELIAIVDLNPGGQCPPPTIEAVSLLADGSIARLAFTAMEEAAATASLAIPEAGGYLYIPYPAIVKAGAYKLLSSRYGLGKLHPNTHLYTSAGKIKDFPGERFRIEESLPYSSKVIKRFAASHGQINVATRNMGISAEALKAKLKVKDGGDRRVIGATVADGSRRLIVVAAG